MTTREQVQSMYKDKSLYRPPSMGYIAKVVGCSKSEVFKYIHELDKKAKNVS